MLIENIELSMSHVGLGALNEYALMVLFGNAHSHSLVQGVGITPDRIKDNQGLLLYPAYFMTHLKIPADSLISSYKLWDRVDVGVDIARYGDTILESKYILGKTGQVSEKVDDWEFDKQPSMIGNSLFIVDAGDTTGAARHVSAPKKECIAEFPKMKKMPESILKAKTIRINGFNIVTNSTLKAEAPYTYYVLNDQDAAPGHAMIFAKFVKIMDWAEHKLLSRDLKPGLPLEVLNNTFILERETFYYGNCFAGEYLEVHINGNIKECPFNFHGDSTQVISAAILEFETEIYKKSDNSLLSMAYTKKLIALPPVLQDLISDIKRIISKHNR